MVFLQMMSGLRWTIVDLSQCSIQQWMARRFQRKYRPLETIRNCYATTHTSMFTSQTLINWPIWMIRAWPKHVHCALWCITMVNWFGDWAVFIFFIRHALTIFLTKAVRAQHAALKSIVARHRLVATSPADTWCPHALQAIIIGRCIFIQYYYHYHYYNKIFILFGM